MDFESPEDDLLEKPKREQPEEEVFYGVPDEEAPAPRRRSSRWPLYIVIGCLLSCFTCCVLPVCGLAVAGVGLAALLENSEVTETKTETVRLETDDPITLTVDNRVGDILIEPGTNDEVVVEYTKRAHGLTKSSAQDELDNILVDIDDSVADQVKIAVTMDSEKDTFFAFSNEVDLTIRVPESLYLDIKNNVGKVTIQGVTARSVQVKNNTGDIEFDGELGTSPTADYSFETNVGSITLFLPDNTYFAVSAETDVGDVTVSDNFDEVNRDDDGSGEVGDRWAGMLGNGNEDPPTLTLIVNVGDITISTR